MDLTYEQVTAELRRQYYDIVEPKPTFSFSVIDEVSVPVHVPRAMREPKHVMLDDKSFRTLMLKRGQHDSGFDPLYVLFYGLPIYVARQMGPRAQIEHHLIYIHSEEILS